MADASFYTAGGTVQASGGLYLVRKADDDLLALCREGSFAFVLTARQMGKSSLMTRTAERLIEEKSRTALIDLNSLGTGLRAEQWYLGLLVEIQRQLELQTRVTDWWRQQSHLGITHRMSLFFEDVLLAEVKERLVLFVDEIDSTLSLGFADDFFASIRSLYNARAQRPELGRLSFVLLGVATPGDLVKDASRTPFNLGQRVELADFTFEEARPLVAGLGLPESQGEQVLRWAMEWTGGHPYLTQRLCQELAQEPPPPTKEGIDRVVARLFLGEKSFEDNNLQFVQDMLTKERAPDVGDVLRTFRQVRRGRRVRDEEQSRVKSHLKLSGVVRRDGDALVTRNRIYREVFHNRWIREHLPFSWRRFAQRAAWPMAAVAFALTLWFTYLVRNAAVDAERQAASARELMERARETLRQTQDEYRFEAAKHQVENEQYRSAKKKVMASVEKAMGKKDAALAQVKKLQALDEEQMASERTRYERLLAEREAELKGARREQAEAAKQLLRARDDLQASSRRLESADALLGRLYRELTFPQGPPNGGLAPVVEKRDQLYGFLNAPPHRGIIFEPCNPDASHEVYRLNDMASSAYSLGPLGSRKDAANASASSIPGAMSAIAEATRSQRALFLLQGKPGAYLVYFDDGRGGLVLELNSSGNTVDVMDPSRTPRCP